MILVRNIFLTVFITVFASTGYGQWRNYVDSADELWFQAADPVLIDHDSEWKAITLYAFFEGVALSVRKREVEGEPMKYVKGLKLPWGERGSKVINFKSEAMYVRREDEMIGSDLQVTLHAGSKASYFVVSLTADPMNAAMKRFLETIRFGGTRLYSQSSAAEMPVSGEPVTFDTLAVSREIEAELKKITARTEPPGKFGKVRQPLPLELNSLSRDVIILRKPRPGYTDDARRRGIQGTILVNVQFLANGDISDITVDDRADRGLGKNVMIAVRKIKFLPAQANGKAIDANRTLRYGFSIY
jgi:TonB family protein